MAFWRSPQEIWRTLERENPIRGPLWWAHHCCFRAHICRHETGQGAPYIVKVWWEDVQCTEHLEPTWTSLNLSWNNACACEQLGNHFKFVGTDLWTIEPIGTYRNQVGTNLEPNGTSLCMEELGDGFSFVFVVFGVFGCCLTHVLGTWCCELIW